MNFGVQATAAAVLRLAVVLLGRAGLPLVATVHDSAVFVARAEDAAEVLLEAQRAMLAAAAYFCPGVRMRVDFSSSVPVVVPGRAVGPLADPKKRVAYDRMLRQARLGASR